MGRMETTVDRCAAHAEAVALAETDPQAPGRRRARLDWLRPPTEVRDMSFDVADFRIRRYADGVLNVCANCVTRHLPERAAQTANLFEGDVRRGRGARSATPSSTGGVPAGNGLPPPAWKGDRVGINRRPCPKRRSRSSPARGTAACTRWFGGVSLEALASRIGDCGARPGSPPIPE